MFTVPIVFIIFNRYDTASQVFDRIREIKPSKLFVIADAARPNKPGESEKCDKVRNLITQVDWDCQVYKNYADINMGCQKRVISGLDWVFDQVDRAIILEDDCLPDISFFPFCNELLERYKDDERIMQISGENKILSPFNIRTSYYFTRSVEIWGWATWARAWHKADMRMQDWPVIRKTGVLKLLWNKNSEAYHWTRLFDKIYNNEFNSWAARWCYSVAKESAFSIAPTVNLVDNIGMFSPDATHGQNTIKFTPNKAVSISSELIHPTYMMIDPILQEKERQARVKEQERFPYPLNRILSKCKQLTLALLRNFKKSE